MSADERSLLALLVDDAAAIVVLAAWAGLERPLADISDRVFVTEVADLVSMPFAIVEKAFRKLQLARVLVDGGITEWGDKVLQANVNSKLGKKA